MRNATEEALARLRAIYGATWQVWTVPRAILPTLWCARRHDDHQHWVNEDTPADLELRLASEES
jgi:hypothetical protein